jgi:hypothetical protein
VTVNRRQAGSCRAAVLSLNFVGLLGWAALPVAAANPNRDVQAEVLRKESAGDLAGARALLEKRADAGSDPAAAQELAEFLDRHGDASSRQAFLKWASAESDPARRKLALRQVVLLDFLSGRSSELAGDLEQYHAAGGTDLNLPKDSKPTTFSTVTIPGPLSSFARMAALAPDLAPEELLPALARNVVTNGYEASGNEVLQPTEYLRLLTRYVGQARELQALAGSNHKIVIPACDSEQTGNLLKVLGYRMRGSCGGDIVLETVNATRAFITVDSAFPLTELEQDLRANHRFELAYAPTAIPVLYDERYWLAALGRNAQSEFIEGFLSDPSLCRLYLGLSHLDRSTAEALRAQAPPSRLKLYAPVLDFFGGMFEVRNGAAVVPGSPKIWAAMVGVSPGNPGAFFERLISTDDGWMASYFDALSRINGPTAAYLTAPERLRRFYDALRGKITSPGPARPVFRSSTELLLLTTSLRIESNGQPHVPGDLEVWRNLFIHHPHGKYDGRLTRSAASWKNTDDLIEALFALSRKAVENEPLKIFLLLNDVDRYRSQPMSAALTARLVAGYRTYGPQYVLLADSPYLSEASIGQYLDLCAQLSGLHDNLLKSDATGSFQAVIELWRILRRQDSIPASAENDSFAKLVGAFGHVKQEADVFAAGRTSVDVLLSASNSPETGTRHERLVELLVGKIRLTEDNQLPSPAENFLRIFDAQHLVTVDALFTASDRLSKGNADAKTLKSIGEQLSRLQESQALRGSLSTEEKSTLAVGYWSERHVEQERKLSVEGLLKNGDKKDSRAVLAPLLRDSLVGLVYSYYAPVGAQLLIANSQVVRSHDFIGNEAAPAQWHVTEVGGTGWPESAGGRLTGSLISVPYAIAEAEQNFLSPRREQALIWADLVPQLIANVTINRWRNVTALQLRWVSLHVERGRMLLAAAALDASLEPKVLDAYRRFASPHAVDWLDQQLRAGEVRRVMEEVPASTLFAIASDPSLANVSPDLPSMEIAELAAQNSPELSRGAIARAFGTPKPTLTHSYQPCLLNLRTFPALMGYSSRILAETWEANNLVYAALADERGVPVDRLDTYIPEWNRSTIENIFATHLEDWPALVRSLNTVSENIRQQGSQRAAVNLTGN